MKETIRLDGTSKQEAIELNVLKWIPTSKLKGVIHVCHGMAEHAERYDEFAQYMNRHGFGVVAHDHRQHGYSVRPDTEAGQFSKEDTWAAIIQDCTIVQKHIRASYDVPMYLMGHSMGSVIARSFLQQTDLAFKKAVVTGIPDMTPPLWRVGAVVAGILGIFNKTKPSAFLNNLSVGKFNDRFSPGLTGYEWLSRDEVICRHYKDDPLCGYAYTPKFYQELSKGMLKTYSKAGIKRAQKIPMLFMCGSDDPAGTNQDRMLEVFEHHQDSGLKDHINQIIYGGMRHEILNEIGREKVFEQILDFLEQ